MSNKLRKHCNHHGEMVNSVPQHAKHTSLPTNKIVLSNSDDITSALESFTLDSGSSDLLMNTPDITADHDIQEELT